MQHLIKGLCIVFSLAFIFGCSGGGDGTGEQPILEGQFIDSAVDGLYFETDSQSGYTDENGTFSFISGEVITFSIGATEIGQGIADDQMTPIDLVAGASDETDAAVTNVCRLLQTLDSDCDTSNGITIPPEVATELDAIQIDFDQSIDDFTNDQAVQDLLATLHASGAYPCAVSGLILRDSFAAQGHLRASLGVNKIFYIKNDAPDGGDGTMDHPFNQFGDALVRSIKGDTFYILYGDGNANELTETVELKPYQRLLGQGVDLVADDQVVVSKSQAPIIGWSGPGETTMVRVNRGVEIAGLIIDGGNIDAYGISGTPDGVTIRDNEIRNLELPVGISVSYGDQEIRTISILRNKFINNQGRVGHVNILQNYIFQVDFSHNHIEACAGPITFYARDNTHVDITVNDNTVVSNNGAGIKLYVSEQGVMSASLERNTLRDNQYDDGVPCTIQYYAALSFTSYNEGSLTADMGGGHLGSSGMNSVYNNADADFWDIYIGGSGTNVVAQYNWWGNPDGIQTGPVMCGGPVALNLDSAVYAIYESGVFDPANQLLSDPNP